MQQSEPIRFAVGPEITDSTSQEEVEEILQRLAETVGATRWVFVAHEERADEDGQDRVHLLDCNMDGFAEQYVDRRWYLIDPHLNGSRESGVVRWGWPTDPTYGQREMRAAWDECGHPGIAVFPAYGPWHVTGALYLAFANDGAEMPFSVHMLRHAIRSTALDVLNWLMKRTYCREVAYVQLSTIERQILQLERIGCTVKQTAEALRTPAKDIQRIVTSLNAKLRVNSKHEAARRAAMAGVL